MLTTRGLFNSVALRYSARRHLKIPCVDEARGLLKASRKCMMQTK